MNNILSTAWRDQQLWSSTADRLKKSIKTWRWTVFALGILGAMLETLAAQVANFAPEATTARSVLAWVGAAALAVASAIVAGKLGQHRIRDWVRARSASEGLKSEVYRYLTESGPYAGTDRSAQLSKRTDEIVKRVRDLEKHTATTTMSEKEPPTQLNVGEYIKDRVNDQIDEYYRPRAKELGRLINQFRAAEFALSLIAAILGVTAAVANAEAVGAWVAVATTVGGAITAHIAAERYEYLVTTYLATARRLESLRDRWLDGAAGKDVGRFVSACEAAISIENQAWMTEWSREDEDEGLPEM